MRNTAKLRGISFELFIVRACQAALFLVLLVVLASAQTQPRPTAQKPTPTRPRPQVTFADEIKRCLTRPADAVMTAQKNADGYYSGQVDSTQATYANDDCKYFIVDVILPEGFKIIGGPTIRNSISIYGEFTDKWSFTQNNCPQASVRTNVSQLEGGSFTQRHSSYSRGKWTGNEGLSLCHFSSESLEVNLPVGGVGITTTYRVLVSPKLNGQPRQARVKWKAVEIPT